jgi:hypothetical protein
VVVQDRAVVYADIDGTTALLFTIGTGAIMLVVWSESLMSSLMSLYSNIRRHARAGGKVNDTLRQGNEDGLGLGADDKSEAHDIRQAAEARPRALSDNIRAHKTAGTVGTVSDESWAAVRYLQEGADVDLDGFNAERHEDEGYWLAVADRLRPHILRATSNYNYKNRCKGDGQGCETEEDIAKLALTGRAYERAFDYIR